MYFKALAAGSALPAMPWQDIVAVAVQCKCLYFNRFGFIINTYFESRLQMVKWDWDKVRGWRLDGDTRHSVRRFPACQLQSNVPECPYRILNHLQNRYWVISGSNEYNINIEMVVCDFIDEENRCVKMATGCESLRPHYLCWALLSISISMESNTK